MNVDFTTKYLGLTLRSPLVASSSPLTRSMNALRQLDEAGVGAVVLPSLFEEQIEHEQMAAHDLYEQPSDAFAESLSYFHELDFEDGVANYVKLIGDAKKTVSVPVIASLNGSSPGGWVEHARTLQEAGADALELNVYYIPTDVSTTALDVEDRYAELVASVRQSLSIPLAVKIGPYFTALAQFAARLATAGADGLVLFNRFLEPECDLEQLTVEPHLELSRPAEARLALRWIAILRDQLEDTSFAAAGGCHSADDALKLLLAGADIVTVTSTLLLNGAEHAEAMQTTMKDWLVEREYESIEQLKGSMSRQNVSDPSQFERANYMKALVSYVDAQ